MYRKQASRLNLKVLPRGKYIFEKQKLGFQKNGASYIQFLKVMKTFIARWVVGWWSKRSFRFAYFEICLQARCAESKYGVKTCIWLFLIKNYARFKFENFEFWDYVPIRKLAQKIIDGSCVSLSPRKAYIFFNKIIRRKHQTRKHQKWR